MKVVDEAPDFTSFGPPDLPPEHQREVEDQREVEELTVEEHQHEQQMLDAIVGTPFNIETVAIDDLQIDSYQRPFSPTDVNRIINEFNPSLLGVIIINIRDNGSRYIVDGQHRVLAQRRRGVHEMYAQVFRGLTVEQEAWLFSESNTRRRAVTPGGKFKARLIAGDRVAMEVRNIVSSFGLRLAFAPTIMDGKTIMAVGSLESIFRDSPTLLRSTLRFIRDTWTDDPDALRYSIIEGVYRYYKQYASQTDMRNLSEKLGMMSARNIIGRAGDLKRSLGGAVPAHVAEAMLQVYNSAKRTGRIVSKYRG